MDLFSYMDAQYKIAIVWLAGFLLCRWMLKAEHEAEGGEYTNGDQAAAAIMSMLSFAMVLFILIRSWAGSAGLRKYWSKPVNPKKDK